jgi:hypothetical protein
METSVSEWWEYFATWEMIAVVVELAAFEMVEIEEALDAICLAKQAVATVTSH